MIIKCRAYSPSNSRERTKQLLFVLLLGITALAVADRAIAETTPVEFSIPAQTVPAALNEFARQARVQLFFITDGFEDVQANAVFGTYPRQQALDLLLAGTGLQASLSSDFGIKVRPAADRTRSAILLLNTVTLSAADTSDDYMMAQAIGESSNVYASQGAAPVAHDGKMSGTVIEEIVVTGTNIRGATNPTAPIISIDREAIEQAGFATVPELLESLPQNVADLSPASVFAVGGADRDGNRSIASTVNLRGLGPDATLVLINGRRLTASGATGAADISTIPLSAIKRVDVLTDGASAIYGADAVGGVVNFVLRDDFDGAETTVQYGDPSQSGGGAQILASQALGKSWDGGSGFLAYEYRDQEELTAIERGFSEAGNFLSDPSQYDLVPSSESHNVLLNASHDITERLSASGHVLFASRDTLLRRSNIAQPEVVTVDAESDQSAVVAQLAYDLNDNLTLEFGGGYDFLDVTNITTLQGIPEILVWDFEDEIWRVNAQISGTAFSMPGGDVKFAIGGEFRSVQSSRKASGDAANTTDRDQERDVTSAFIEALIPLIGESNSTSQRLEVSLAGRYEDFSDFGSKTTPKFGIFWSPNGSLSFRASYGESFKAPRFSQQLGRTTAALFTFPDPPSATGITPTFLLSGSPLPGELQAEESESFTAGFDLTPQSLPRLSVSVSYFDIDFTNRVGLPAFGGIFDVLAREDEFGSIITRNLTQTQIDAIVATSSPLFNFSDLFGDPFVDFSGAGAVVDIRSANLASRVVSGLDLTGRYSWSNDAGEFDLSANLSDLFEYQIQNTPESPVFEQVDTLLFPVDLRARLGFAWASNGGFNAAAFLKYVDGYRNEELSTKVGSWTTVDLIVGFAFDNGLSLSFQADNLFDRDPPFVESSVLSQPIGYDPLNANPLGRFLSLRLRKSW